MKNNQTPEEAAQIAENLLQKIAVEGKDRKLLEDLAIARKSLADVLEWDDDSYDHLFKRMTAIIDPKKEPIPRDPFAKVMEKRAHKEWKNSRFARF